MIRIRRPSFRLQRLARSRGARVFAHVMAVLLILVNFSAWAMPVSSAAEVGSVHAAMSGAPHHHCEEAGAKTKAGAEQAPHGKGCPCCPGNACACLQSCSDALTLIFPDLLLVPAAQPLPAAEVSFADVAGGRRLRPPIA